MSAACCLEQVVGILIWDCCALQISISSELIRCCVSSEVWMFLKLRLVVYASRIYPGVLTCNEGTCMLSGRYVSSALLRRSVAKLLNRSMPTSVPLIRKAINAMMANIVFDDFATGCWYMRLLMDDGSSCEAEWMFHTLQSGLRHFLRSLFSQEPYVLIYP